MLETRNDALNLNPPNAQEHITTHGSDWYWAVFAVMAASALIFGALSTRQPRDSRIFYYITIALLTTAAIAYYTMASDLGVAPVTQEFQRSNPLVRGQNRQIFYARYIDWVITTPLLLMDILLTGGLTWSQILWTIFIDIVMVVTGLFAALTPSRYKWGYFTFGCVALLFIIWQVCFVGRANARILSPEISRLYNIISFWTIFLWCLYPIAFGLSEGGNVISSDSEAIFYGILDIMAKPVFGALLIWGHRKTSMAQLGLLSTNVGGDVRREKNGAATTAA